MLVTSLIFCFERFLVFSLLLPPSFIVVRRQMAELNWGAFCPPPPTSIIGLRGVGILTTPVSDCPLLSPENIILFKIWIRVDKRFYSLFSNVMCSSVSVSTLRHTSHPDPIQYSYVIIIQLYNAIASFFKRIITRKLHLPASLS